MGTRSFPGVKNGRGVTLTPHLFLVRGHERVELYLYSPYGPYGLYRTSVPVQGCTLLFSYQPRQEQNTCIRKWTCILGIFQPTGDKNESDSDNF